MPTENVLGKLDHPPCRFLMSKEMFIHLDEAEWNIYQSHSGIFWCTHTQNCLGPDGRVAEPESCTPGRACHEPR